MWYIYFFNTKIRHCVGNVMTIVAVACIRLAMSYLQKDKCTFLIEIFYYMFMYIGFVCVWLSTNSEWYILYMRECEYLHTCKLIIFAIVNKLLISGTIFFCWIYLATKCSQGYIYVICLRLSEKECTSITNQH